MNRVSTGYGIHPDSTTLITPRNYDPLPVQSLMINDGLLYSYVYMYYTETN